MSFPNSTAPTPALLHRPLQAPAAAPFPSPALQSLAAELQAAGGPQERSRLLVSYARRLPPLPEAAHTDAHRVMGCTAQVGWARC